MEAACISVKSVSAHIAISLEKIVVGDTKETIMEDIEG